MSPWQRIYTHLTSKGFDVYSPGQHQGECTSPYIVLKDAGSSKLDSFSSKKVLYDLMCYVPKEAFSTLEPFVDEVEAAMKLMYPEVISLQFRTPSYLDDSVKAHMISTQYQNNKKL